MQDRKREEEEEGRKVKEGNILTFPSANEAEHSNRNENVEHFAKQNSNRLKTARLNNRNV